MGSLPSNPIARGVLGLATFGASEAYGGVQRSVEGYKTMQRRPGELAAQAARDQAAQSADLQKQMLLQPKSTTADSFLANKAKQLANLRLGLASTISPGVGGSGISTLVGSTPGMKTRLGT